MECQTDGHNRGKAPRTITTHSIKTQRKEPCDYNDRWHGELLGGWPPLLTVWRRLKWRSTPPQLSWHCLTPPFRWIILHRQLYSLMFPSQILLLTEAQNRSRLLIFPVLQIDFLIATDLPTPIYALKVPFLLNATASTSRKEDSHVFIKIVVFQTLRKKSFFILM